MTPNRPTEEQVRKKLQPPSQLWLWFFAAAAAVLLGERAIMWVLANFNAIPKGFAGLDIPTVLSLAGTAYATCRWLFGKIQATLAVVEELKDAIATLEDKVEKTQATLNRLGESNNEVRAKQEYLELRVDLNDARISDARNK